MIPATWTPHRRPDDDEILGYLESHGDGTVQPRTLFGYPLGSRVETADAERLLDSLGLSYLAERWLLTIAGRADSIGVQIVEVSPRSVTVASTDLGYEGDYGTRFTLDVPVDPDALRPERALAR
jgi:hypothetical protein